MKRRARPLRQKLARAAVIKAEGIADENDSRDSKGERQPESKPVKGTPSRAASTGQLQLPESRTRFGKMFRRLGDRQVRICVSAEATLSEVMKGLSASEWEVKARTICRLLLARFKRLGILRGYSAFVEVFTAIDVADYISPSPAFHVFFLKVADDYWGPLVSTYMEIWQRRHELSDICARYGRTEDVLRAPIQLRRAEARRKARETEMLFGGGRAGRRRLSKADQAVIIEGVVGRRSALAIAESAPEIPEWSSMPKSPNSQKLKRSRSIAFPHCFRSR